MMKYQVRDPSMALVYLTDCTLATVCDMAMKKSRPKYEFERQISMAQTAIDWMREFGVDYSGTRAASVDLCGGSVQAWAATFINNN